MKIIFFGTPEFAVPSLQMLVESKHSVEAVVTTPDKQRGRGKKVSFTPVKQFAIENNIPVIQPEKLRDENFIDEIREFGGDLFVVVAYRILPREVFMMPTKGSFNLHGSLLPKYRGAAPIQWSIIKGEKETGLTTFFLQDKVDTGNIIMQEKLEIFEDDNLGTLHDKMMVKGAELVLKTVELIDKGEVNTFPQNDSLASPAPKITKEICKIDWDKNSIEIHNLVRGLSPYPCTFFIHENKNYKIYRTRIPKTEFHKDLKPGSLFQTKKELFIGTADGTIQILELQPEGKKRMTAEEFLRGNSLT
ncbi:methionyl-tRNA formyltransferase [Bacteroidota bacterium]